MLTVLTQEHPKISGIGQKLLDRIRPGKITCWEEQAAGCRYRRIHVVTSRRGIPWKKVASLTKGEKILLPREISIPPGVRMEPIVPKKLQPKLALAMLLGSLEKTKIPLSARTVGIIDWQGEYQQETIALAQEAATIRVLTQHPQEYRSFQKQMLDWYGAPILVGERLESMEDCMAVYCPQEYENLKNSSLKGVVFAGAPVKLGGRCQILENFFPGEEIEVPAGIHPADFFGALYEQENLSQWEHPPIVFGECKGRKNSMEEIGEYINRTFGTK